MQNKKTKHKYQRSHHARLGSMIMACTVVFGLTSLGHIRLTEHHATVAQLPRILADNLERESETERHAVRLDVGLRLPSTSGL